MKFVDFVDFANFVNLVRGHYSYRQRIRFERNKGEVFEAQGGFSNKCDASHCKGNGYRLL